MNSAFLERNRLPKQEVVTPPTQQPRAYCLLLLKGCQTRWFDTYEQVSQAERTVLTKGGHALSFIWCDGELRYVPMPDLLPITPNPHE